MTENPIHSTKIKLKCQNKSEIKNDTFKIQKLQKKKFKKLQIKENKTNFLKKRQISFLKDGKYFLKINPRAN